MCPPTLPPPLSWPLALLTCAITMLTCSLLAQHPTLHTDKDRIELLITKLEDELNKIDAERRECDVVFFFGNLHYIKAAEICWFKKNGAIGITDLLREFLPESTITKMYSCQHGYIAFNLEMIADLVHAFLAECFPTISHLPCTPPIHTTHAHLPVTPPIHTAHAHRPCTSPIHTCNSHLPCTPPMHTTHAHLQLASHPLASHPCL